MHYSEKWQQIVADNRSDRRTNGTEIKAGAILAYVQNNGYRKIGTERSAPITSEETIFLFEALENTMISEERNLVGVVPGSVVYVNKMWAGKMPAVTRRNIALPTEGELLFYNRHSTV